jgi:hypothetical protein
MSTSSPAAGGFFLVVAILAGFGIGVSQGNPLGGTLIGTIIGIVLATILWIIDRHRTGR